MVSRTSTADRRLHPNDFRRLGVRPHEYRLAVIRRAAMFRGRRLAEQQLSDPNPKLERQLTRLATSTYRLLDPRNRHDQHHRLHVGRIHPQILHGAGQTCFHNELSDFGTSPQRLAKTPFERSLLSDAELIELLDIDSPPRGTRPRTPEWAVRLSDADLLKSTPLSRRLRRLRSRLALSPVRWAVAGLLMVTLLGFAIHNWLDRQVLIARDVRPTNGQPSPEELEVEPAERGSAKSLARGNVADQISERITEIPANTTGRLVPRGLQELLSSEPINSPSQVDDSRPPAIASTKPNRLPDSSEQPLAVGGNPVQEPGGEADNPPANLAASTDFPTQEPSGELQEMPEISLGAQLDQEQAGTSGQVAEAGQDVRRNLADAWAAIDAIGTLPNSLAPIDKPVPLLDLKSEMVAKPFGLEPLRKAVPDEASLRLARRGLIDLMPSLDYALEAKQAPSRIEHLEWIRSQFAPGSSERWILTHLIAEAAWLIETVPQVERRLRILALQYEVSSETLLADTYVNASLHATLPDTRSHLIQNGLRLAERLLLNSQVARCREVLEAIIPMVSGASVQSDSVTRYLNDYSDALVLMERHAEVIERVRGQSGEPEPEDAKILGRHYCLILRQWDQGLTWIQHTADSRIARAAQQELSLGASPSGQQLQAVAANWVVAASRATGRSADSMRLHAIDLLRRGRAAASGSNRIEIDRQLQHVLESVPDHLMPLVADTVKTEAGSRPGGSLRSPQTPLF